MNRSVGDSNDEEIVSLINECDNVIKSNNKSSSLIQKSKKSPWISYFLTSRRVQFNVLWFFCTLILPFQYTIWRIRNKIPPPVYCCPYISDITLSTVDLSSVQEFYNKTNHNNTVENYKNKSTYDGWHTSYNENKEKNYDWKHKYFQYLQSGDKIYESGCGFGYNLLMTMEILQDFKELKNIQIYGNDYLESSVKIANDLLNCKLPSNSIKESICVGDSTNLFYVPSDTFDLAYTGYIDPLVDPKNIFTNFKPQTRENLHKQICLEYRKKQINQTHDWALAKLAEIDQHFQNEWFAKWAGELIRITRPGGIIIIENISLPQCYNFKDWGGVSKSWWNKTLSLYHWDIESSSLRFEDVNGNNKRYNLAMRKKHF